MKQFAVIGLGRFGYAVAKELEKLGHEVLAIDNDEERVEAIKDRVTQAIIADAANEQDFKMLGLDSFDAVVVAIGENLPSSIMACMLAKEAGVPLVVAKSSLDIHGKILRRVGADEIIYPEADMGLRLAHRLSSHNVLDHIKFSDEFDMSTIVVPREWIGRSIGNVNVRAKYGINIVALRAGKDTIISPKPDYIFTQGDILSIIAKTDDMKRLEKRFS